MTLLYLTRDYCVLTDGFAAAPGSFLFSLRNNDNLPPFKSPLKNENTWDAIYRHSKYGPTFGSGKDLLILPNNRQSKTNFGSTYKLPSDYTYIDSRRNSLLAGSYEFTPKEVEVLHLM